MIKQSLDDMLRELKSDPAKNKILRYEVESMRNYEQRTVAIKSGNFFGYLNPNQKTELRNGLRNNMQ